MGRASQAKPLHFRNWLPGARFVGGYSMINWPVIPGVMALSVLSK